jgi:hypothetical protein
MLRFRPTKLVKGRAPLQRPALLWISLSHKFSRKFARMDTELEIGRTRVKVRACEGDLLSTGTFRVVEGPEDYSFLEADVVGLPSVGSIGVLRLARHA